ncbi:hypothetical protein C8R43DRAFT_1131787 [Mycena crocata]|nr:hypothetical protein C8R43DRAFT_1131787 [Mycena crocata]
MDSDDEEEATVAQAGESEGAQIQESGGERAGGQHGEEEARPTPEGERAEAQSGPKERETRSGGSKKKTRRRGGSALTPPPMTQGGASASTPDSPSHPAISTPPTVVRPQARPNWRGAGPLPGEKAVAAPGVPRGGEDGDPASKEAASKSMWDIQDMENWPDELKRCFEALSRGREWGGEEWEACVLQLLALERARGFAAKGLLSAPSGKKSPDKVPAWMRAYRRWENTAKITSAVGPRDVEELFAAHWWGWWAHAQPPARTDNETESLEWTSPGDMDVEAWKDVGKMVGRNGMLLYVGALLWWGEAVVAMAEDDEEELEGLLDEWREAVEDVRDVLEMAVKTVTDDVGPDVGPSGVKKTKSKSVRKPVARKARAPATSKAPAPTPAKTRKRKAAEIASTSAEKENEKP